jgi:hypothetical protein
LKHLQLLCRTEHRHYHRNKATELGHNAINMRYAGLTFKRLL